jgi:hypothetical protein
MDLRFRNEAYQGSTWALDRVLSGFERSFLSWTLWSYMPGNTKQFGDEWNGEDLSLYCSDEKDRGSRALLAAIRPFPFKLTGTPLETEFNVRTKRFFLKVRLLTASKLHRGETLVFIPHYHYPRSIQWRVGGKGSSFIKSVNYTMQVLVWSHDVSPGQTSVEPDEEFVDQWLEVVPKGVIF